MAVRKISVEQYERLKKDTFGTVWAILEAVKVLVSHTKSPAFVRDNTPKVCTALYTHAIEEYGKLLYLASLSADGGFVDIDYDSKFKNHSFKFRLALAKLPRSCTLLHKGGFGANFGKGFDIDTETDWETRLSLLNTDFESNGNIS